MKKTFLQFLGFCLIAALVTFSAAAAGPPEFSADVKTTDAANKVSTGKIFMKGDKIRQELVDKGESMTIIIRLDKKVSWTLLPNNLFLEVKIPFDPANPGTDPSVQFEMKTIGTEVVSGYSCQVNQYTYKDKKYGILIQWVADKLGFPIKTQTKDAGGKVTSTTEYSNIKLEKQADSLFEIPPGYEKMSFPF